MTLRRQDLQVGKANQPAKPQLQFRIVQLEVNVFVIGVASGTDFPTASPVGEGKLGSTWDRYPLDVEWDAQENQLFVLDFQEQEH